MTVDPIPITSRTMPPVTSTGRPMPPVSVMTVWYGAQIAYKVTFLSCNGT